MRTNLIVSSLWVCFWVASSFFLPSVTQAGEGGRSEYPVGLTDMYVGYLPEPGFYFTNFMYVSDSELETIVQGQTIRYDLTLFAEAPSILGVTPFQILGANWSWTLRIPFAYGKATASLGQLTLNQDETFNLGDMAVAPLVLGWQIGKYSHVDFGTAFYAPTGAYNQNSLLNIGANRWAAEADAGYTLLNYEYGYEVSGLLGYTIPFVNSATDYTSGQELHLDYTITQHFPKNWAVGVVGYGFLQTTADSGAGAVLGSFQGEAFALGPLVSWTSQGEKPVHLVLKDYIDISTKNRFSGQAAWLNLTLQL